MPRFGVLFFREKDFKKKFNKGIDTPACVIYNIHAINEEKRQGLLA